MMRLSEIVGQRVMAAGSATTVGRVSGIVVDPRDAAVVAVRVERSPGGDTLPWPDITDLGPDAVMVSSPEVVRPAAGRAAELLAGDPQLTGKRLLTDGGDELGMVADVSFDSDSRVTAVHTADRSVPGASLLGCGSYAVVVRGQEPGTGPA